MYSSCFVYKLNHSRRQTWRRVALSCGKTWLSTKFIRSVGSAPHFMGSGGFGRQTGQFEEGKSEESKLPDAYICGHKFSQAKREIREIKFKTRMEFSPYILCYFRRWRSWTLTIGRIFEDLVKKRISPSTREFSELSHILFSLLPTPLFYDLKPSQSVSDRIQRTWSSRTLGIV